MHTEYLLAAAAAFVVSLLVAAIVAWAHLIVVEPNEVVVLSGRMHRGLDGVMRGYRVVTQGRALRIPLLETASRLSTSPISVDLTLSSTSGHGGTKVSVEATALVAVSREPTILPNAVERFLDQPPAHIATAAQQILESALRQIVTRIEPDELRQDREMVTHMMLEESESDLRQLGLTVASLHMRDVRPR